MREGKERVRKKGEQERREKDDRKGTKKEEGRVKKKEENLIPKHELKNGRKDGMIEVKRKNTHTPFHSIPSLPP